VLGLPLDGQKFQAEALSDTEPVPAEEYNVVAHRTKLEKGRPIAIRSAILCLLLSSFAVAQSKLSTHWEELTGADFMAAVRQSQGVCLLPFGILEKHGPHLPLGTDLINVRYATEKAAEAEYAVIYPA
jgi:hypothetical protein